MARQVYRDRLWSEGLGTLPLPALRRFESEARATAGLTPVNTVEIYDFGDTQDGTFYYAARPDEP